MQKSPIVCKSLLARETTKNLGFFCNLDRIVTDNKTLVVHPYLAEPDGVYLRLRGHRDPLLAKADPNAASTPQVHVDCEMYFVPAFGDDCNGLR